jgi:hypothetical protein
VQPDGWLITRRKGRACFAYGTLAVLFGVLLNALGYGATEVVL